jgi:hypothetical protein
LNDNGGALSRLEETQAALRQSIEISKKLVEESDRLIRQHRKEVGGEGTISASIE